MTASESWSFQDWFTKLELGKQQKITFLCFMFLMLASSVSYAGFYKCTEHEKTSYQSSPCKESQNQTLIEFAKPSNNTRNNENYSSPPANQHISNDSSLIERDEKGKIKRSASARSDFKKLSPCPANGHQFGSCPGYIIDHIKALACGGIDDPSNMQWQTVQDASEKDKSERKGCQTTQSEIHAQKTKRQMFRDSGQ
jgi:hypothetical protein